MIDPRFDPRSPECESFWAGEDCNDPSKPLVAYETSGADPGRAWRVAICWTAAIAVFIAANPASAAAGTAIALALGGIFVTVGPTGAVVGLSAYGVVLASVINGILGAALSFGINSLTAKSGPKPQPGTIDALRNIYRGPSEPAVVVFGETVLSGLLVYAKSVDFDGLPKKEGFILHVVLAICVGPIDAITRITLNDLPHTAAKFRDRTLFIKKLGWRDQQPILGPVKLKGDDIHLPEEWLAKSRKFSGVAYVHAILRFAASKFPTGAPGIRFRVRGCLMWDFREDVSVGGTQSFGDETTWKYSNNPVVCGVHYLTNRVWGRSVPLGDLDLDGLAAAANECDATLTVTVNREKNPDQPDTDPETIEITKYACDGSFLTTSRPEDILRAIATSMNGGFFPYAGKWTAAVGAPKPLETWPIMS